jgi:hypothetical protein
LEGNNLNFQKRNKEYLKYSSSCCNYCSWSQCYYRSTTLLSITARPENARIKAGLRNELCHLVALKVLDRVFSNEAMKMKDQNQLMFDMDHGNIAKDISSHIQMVADGMGDYVELYKIETVAVTDSNATNLFAPRKLLKPEISRSEMPVVAGKQITVEVLVGNSFSQRRGPGVNQKVSCRTLHRNTRDSLLHIKKALAFVKPLLKEDGSPILSGTSLDDIDAKVLDCMYTLLNGRSSADDAIEDEAKGEAEEEAEQQAELGQPAEEPNQARVIRLSSWFFHGWAAFKLTRA